MHVKTGDKVIIIAGKDKGKTGTIIKSFPKKERVIVEQINMAKKHQKPNAMNPEGGIIEKELPIHVSNVAHIDPETKKATRIKIEKKEDGKKVRVAVKSGKEIK